MRAAVVQELQRLVRSIAYLSRELNFSIAGKPAAIASMRIVLPAFFVLDTNAGVQNPAGGGRKT